MALDTVQKKRRRSRVFRSAPSIGDLSASLLGTRDQVLACLRIQARARTWLRARTSRKIQDEHEHRENAIDDKHECAICCSLLCEPARWPAESGSTCDHVFCKACIAQWMETQPLEVTSLNTEN